MMTPASGKEAEMSDEVAVVDVGQQCSDLKRMDDELRGI